MKAWIQVYTEQCTTWLIWNNNHERKHFPSWILTIPDHARTKKTLVLINLLFVHWRSMHLFQGFLHNIQIYRRLVPDKLHSLFTDNNTFRSPMKAEHRDLSKTCVTGNTFLWEGWKHYFFISHQINRRLYFLINSYQSSTIIITRSPWQVKTWSNLGLISLRIYLRHIARCHIIRKVCKFHQVTTGLIVLSELQQVQYNIMWMKKLKTISLFNNSEKLVQILLEFSQQIVEGYKFVLAKFRWKRPFQSTQVCDSNNNKNNKISLFKRQNIAF